VKVSQVKHREFLLEGEAAEPLSLTLAAGTIVVFGRELIGKPSSARRLRMSADLHDNWHANASLNDSHVVRG
jgi:hypothetical protein